MTVLVRYSDGGEIYSTSAEKLVHVRQGFWVNRHGDFCLPHEGTRYILPHMILSIVKEVE